MVGRLIRIIKDMLKSILGRTSLDYEELLTVLYEVENVINSRPLTYILEDIQNLMPLNPNKFLRDNVEGSTIEFDHINGTELNKCWQYFQKLGEDLRKRFRAEYLGQLKNSKKASKIKEQVKLGDIVLVGNENSKRIDWQLGRIIKLYLGKDRHVRGIQVKTRNGDIVRPLQNIYPLEMSEQAKKMTVLQSIPNGRVKADLKSPPVTSRSGRIIHKPKRFVL
ncbi:uncharacterized protein LOC118203158 [Stegodyphus dumicola]|uniref:uncharacterized protein LOC118203158 n=1 Tax=Stegodyphus dumicola TaxID=202533 RepID=UPI0015B24105|nr:uncharacterized protein LOC118203158 [Stegodyphus dumicola]